MRSDRDKRTDSEREIDDFLAQFETPVDELSADISSYLDTSDTTKATAAKTFFGIPLSDAVAGSEEAEKVILFFLQHLPDLRLVDDHIDGVDDMSLWSIACTEHIGEILVEHLHIIHKIVETATVLKPVPSHHTVVLDLDFPALHLCLPHQVDQAVLVVSVVVERELKRFSCRVHARLRKVETAIP